MVTRNEVRYYNIPTGKNKSRKCKICNTYRRTTNKENPFVCEIDLRTTARDLIIWRKSNSYIMLLGGVVIGFLIGISI